MTTVLSTSQIAAASAAANEPAKTDRSVNVRRSALVEQPVRPRHRGVQRPVAGRRARPGGQQLEPSVEPGRHLGDVEGVQPGRRQLDRQRQPVESTHDLGDDRQLVGVGIEAGRHGAGPIDEQLNGRRIVGGRRERRHRAQPLAAHPQALPARRQHRHVRAPGEHCLHEAGDRLEDVLAVVEQQHDLVVGEHGGDPIGEPHAGATVDGERGRDGIDRRVLARRGQLAHDDRTIGARGPQAGADLDEHPRLAHTARSDQRDETVGIDHRQHVVEQRLAADQRGHRNRQPARRGPTRLADATEQAGVLSGQRRRRVDAQLVAEQPPEVVVDAQRLDRAAGTGQRRHQEGTRALAQRFLGGQRGQLDDDAVDVARREPTLGAHLHGADPQLVQADRLDPPVVEVVELRIRRTVPALEDVVDRRDDGGIDRPAVVHRRGQAVGIEIDPRRVAGGSRRPPTRSTSCGNPRRSRNR